MNYHILPCGTVIPPEGIEAWVKSSYSNAWTTGPIRIIAYHNHVMDLNGNKWDNYSLTDPTLPKRRLVKPMELAGKWLRSKASAVFVYEANGDTIYSNSFDGFVDNVSKYYDGYSDTPTSEIKSFWVEEV
jgi:hypothetical protein